MKRVINWFINGATNESVFKRILFLYFWFFIVYIFFTIVSHFIFPEGFFRGSNPVINGLELSKSVFTSWIQIFIYNCFPLTLIIASNLLTAKYNFSNERFIPMGYLAFTTLTIICAVYLGTWSFEVITQAPSLMNRIVLTFDIAHNSGLVELSSYLIGAAASYNLSLWYCDNKKVLFTKKAKDIKLNLSEKVLLPFTFVLLLSATLIEAISISKIG
jgi:hypothetical protein